MICKSRHSQDLVKQHVLFSWHWLCMSVLQLSTGSPVQRDSSLSLLKIITVRDQGVVMLLGPTCLYSEGKKTINTCEMAGELVSGAGICS